jgi:hypothetical protein
MNAYRKKKIEENRGEEENRRFQEYENYVFNFFKHSN